MSNNLIRGLLADQSPFESISRYLRTSTERSDFTYFIGIGCGLLLLWGVFLAFDLGYKWYQANSNTPGSLLLDLCELHELNRHDRQLLEAAAQLAPATLPASAMLDPGRLNRLALERPDLADRCVVLARRLFGDLA